MSFAGMSYLAIVLAAVAAWLAGALWYGVLSGPWVAAQGKTMESFKAEHAAQKGTPAAWIPFVLCFLAELVMAWVLAGIIAHLGPVTFRNGVISAAFVWLGFVITTMAVNNAFTWRKATLTLIDAGHWLVVLLIMGAVIGWMGV